MSDEIPGPRPDIPSGNETFAMPPFAEQKVSAINGLPIKRELGYGGTGRTVLSELPDGTEVVVKVSHNTKDRTNPSFFRAVEFLDEASKEAWNIPRGYGHSMVTLNGAEHPYYVMEYIDGKTLTDTMVAGDLDLSEIFHVLGGISYCVDKIRPYIADFKPDNIIIRKNTDIPMLIDLDNLNKAGNPPSEHVTPSYCGPDIARGIWDTIPIGSETNTWTLGAIAYRMLTGKKFFGDLQSGAIADLYRFQESYEQYLAQQLQESNLDENIQEIFSRALSYTSTDRPPKTITFVRELHDAYFSKDEKPQGKWRDRVRFPKIGRNKREQTETAVPQKNQSGRIRSQPPERGEFE